jgi:hypothetical protein
MWVTGHRSDSTFRPYDIASLDDKLEAIRKARAYAATREAVGQNVAEFSASQSTLRTHVDEKAEITSGIWLGGRDSNPKDRATPEQTAPTGNLSDDKKTQ